MEFVQRSGEGPAPQSAPRTGPAPSGGGVSDILAAYGVEPARKGSRPEIDEDEEDREPVGASGEPTTNRRLQRQRASFDRALLEQVAGSGVIGGRSYSRAALEDKYPAIRDGGR